MTISKAIFRQEALDDQQHRAFSKKSVQQGRSHFGARSVLPVREYGKMARTPLMAFFNRPFLHTRLRGYDVKIKVNLEQWISCRSIMTGTITPNEFQ